MAWMEHRGRSFGNLTAFTRDWDDLYHSLSLKMGMSDSTFIILYTIAELGDGCSQKEICEQVSISKQTINSSNPEAGGKRRHPPGEENQRQGAAHSLN